MKKEIYNKLSQEDKIEYLSLRQKVTFAYILFYFLGLISLAVMALLMKRNLLYVNTIFNFIFLMLMANLVGFMINIIYFKHKEKKFMEKYE
jgi:positive regulator of sigma E activity